MKVWTDKSCKPVVTMSRLMGKQTAVLYGARVVILAAALGLTLNWAVA